MEHTATPQVLLLVDVETTGLEPPRAELCEIGAVLFSTAHRAVIQQLSFLLPVTVNDAEAINGIDPSLTLQSAPTAEPRALFFSLVAQADALVAHNAAFDRPWIEGFFALNGQPAPTTPWICTCEDIDWPGVRPNPCPAPLQPHARGQGRRLPLASGAEAMAPPLHRRPDRGPSL